MRLVLASASPSRRALLEAAGLAVEVRPSGLNEDAIKARLSADGAAPEEVAMALARAKGEAGSKSDPDATVIAGDQILVCDGRLFDKPRDLHEARDHLRVLRGRSHILIGATVLYQGGGMVWSHVDRAVLTMRPFTDAFLETYLADTGTSILSSVGAYRLEDQGVQLFETVEGGYFTILGLPVIQVLAALRDLGAVAE